MPWDTVKVTHVQKPDLLLIVEVLEAMELALLRLGEKLPTEADEALVELWDRTHPTMTVTRNED